MMSTADGQDSLSEIVVPIYDYQLNWQYVTESQLTSPYPSNPATMESFLSSDGDHPAQNMFRNLQQYWYPYIYKFYGVTSQASNPQFSWQHTKEWIVWFSSDQPLRLIPKSTYINYPLSQHESDYYLCASKTAHCMIYGWYRTTRNEYGNGTLSVSNSGSSPRWYSNWTGTIGNYKYFAFPSITETQVNSNAEGLLKSIILWGSPNNDIPASAGCLACVPNFFEQYNNTPLAVYDESGNNLQGYSMNYSNLYDQQAALAIPTDHGNRTDTLYNSSFFNLTPKMLEDSLPTPLYQLIITVRNAPSTAPEDVAISLYGQHAVLSSSIISPYIGTISLILKLVFAFCIGLFCFRFILKAFNVPIVESNDSGGDE